MPRVADVVFEENLVREFFNFYKQNTIFNTKTILNLLSFYKPFYVTIDQLEELLGDKTLVQNLLATENCPWVVYSVANESKNITAPTFNLKLLEKMALQSNFKICLTKGSHAERSYRTIDINNSKLKSNYSEKFISGANRNILQKQLKLFFSDAEKIEFFDNYLKKHHLDKIFRLFNSDSLSNIDLIFYVDTKIVGLKQDIRNMFEGKAKNVSVRTYNADKMHDRYIKINDLIEVLLSSGIEYIFNDRKECIYTIFRY